MSPIAIHISPYIVQKSHVIASLAPFARQSNLINLKDCFGKKRLAMTDSHIAIRTFAKRKLYFRPHGLSEFEIRSHCATALQMPPSLRT